MINYSLIQKSQLEGALRIDAEYYQSDYTFLLDKLRRNEIISIDTISEKVTQGPNPTFLSEGKNCLNGRNVKSYRVDAVDSNHVSPDEFNRFRAFCVRPGDILITLKGLGSIGKIGYVFEDIDAIFSRDIGLIRTKENSESLFAFLLSKYGVAQIERSSTGGTGQRTLTTNYIKQFQIPKFNSQTTSVLKTLVNDSELEHQNFLSCYKQAEGLLLKELGIKNVVFEDELSCVVNYADVVTANRMDAEYFQPKYAFLIKKLQSKKTNPLTSFVKDYSTGYTFKSENYQEEGIPLIRINNIRKGFIDLTNTAYLSETDYLLFPKDVAKPGDIVLSMSGTIGMSAVIPSDVVKCSINQRILRFTPKDINPDLLALILNSIVGSFQLERIGTGGVQTNISYKDIQNILIPVLPREIQKEIAELVRKSHEARKKSKELLAQAKREVEEMIEKGGRN